jgi:hypothetical protein
VLDVFRVGVHIGMTTNSAQVLGTMLRDLGILRGSVAELNKNLEKLKWTIGGAVAAMAGFETLKGLWHLVEAGKELNKELERTRQLGGDFAQSLPQTRARAIDVSRSVPTTTPSENVKVLRELGTQLQNNEAARDILPMAEKAAYVIHNFTGEAIDNIVKNLVKVADIRAQIFTVGADGQEHVDPAKVQAEFDAAAKGLILGGGYISSGGLVTMARQAGVPAKSMTKEAFYAAMVEAAVSQGAARAGTSTTSLFSQLVGGTMPLHTAEEEQRMGLLKAGEWRSDHGHVVLSPAAQQRFEAAMTDPMAFITGPLNDLMNKQGMTAQQKIAEVFKLFGRQTTQRLAAEGLSSEPQFARARKMFADIPDIDEMFKSLQQMDLDTNITSFTQAWKGLMEVLGEQGVPVAISILHGLTEAMHAMTAWVAANPDAARHLMEFAAGVAAVTALGGSIVVFTTAISPFTAAMKGLIGVFAGVKAAAVTEAADAVGLAATGIVGAVTTILGAAAAIGLIAKLGSDAETPKNRRALEELNKERRSPEGGPNGQTYDGFGPDGRPLTPEHPMAGRRAYGDAPGGRTGAPMPVYVVNSHDIASATVGVNTRFLTDQATAPKTGPTAPQVRIGPLMPGTPSVYVSP